MSENTLKILIVEDDFSFALELETLVEGIGYQIADVVDNSAEALEMIYLSSPDLILMDIDIKGRMSGIEIGQKIKHLEIPIIYITSFDDEAHYQAAQKSNMVSYLVKPVNRFILKSTINLAIQNIQLSKAKKVAQEDSGSDFLKKDNFFFKKKEVYHKVGLEEIEYVESDDKYCFIHTDFGQKFMVRITLSLVEAQLPTEMFIRIHRSYVVMKNKISTINFMMGTLSVGKKELPISRSYRKSVQLIMNKF